MTEVYRSFEGKLDVDNQDGYIINELNDFYEIEFLSVWQGENNKVRVRKNRLPESDFGNITKIVELQTDIEYGRADCGQCWYKGKWWGYDTICKIQRANQNGDWRRFV